MENINKKQKNKEMKDTSEDYSIILIDRDTYIGMINLYDICETMQYMVCTCTVYSAKNVIFFHQALQQKSILDYNL